MSRTSRFNDLPPLPLKADVETKAVLKKAITAGRALAELKGLGTTIPNQALLVNSLILQEARASSEIENITTKPSGKIKPVSGAYLARPLPMPQPAKSFTHLQKVKPSSGME